MRGGQMRMGRMDIGDRLDIGDRVDMGDRADRLSEQRHRMDVSNPLGGRMGDGR